MWAWRSSEDTLTAHTPYGTIRAKVGQGAGKAGKAVTAAAKPPRPPSGRRQEGALDCTAWDTVATPATVKWEGGADLLVPLFVPPVLMSSPGSTYYITETTQNRGNLPSPASVTQYYLSTTETIDPSTALVVGERAIPALTPGERSAVQESPFTVPATLAPGTYYLGACADANGQVIETDEANNCSYASLLSRIGIVGSLPANRSPDCSKATATPAIL